MSRYDLTCVDNMRQLLSLSQIDSESSKSVTRVLWPCRLYPIPEHALPVHAVAHARRCLMHLSWSVSLTRMSLWKALAKERKGKLCKQ